MTEDNERVGNRRYYDEFSNWYENNRGHGYHQMLDDLEVDLVERYGQAKDVLEVGCGTGLLLQRVASFAKQATGVDLSAGMLAQACKRGLDAIQASATALPFDDSTFDVVYSFKVLSHIEDIETAMSEMARVTRPGGVVLAEFYNPMSLRYLIKSLKPPTAISEATSDEAVFTRYDSPSKARSYLPESLRYETARGVRIVTPVSTVHNIPWLGSVIRSAEIALADVPVARQLAGFFILVARKL